ncbi:MAG: glycogen/starch/alpha-glucan phosphorylase [Turneriella sp.]|nr:glycogen/starch/alpha-glucan phosphorylase [Turneriella sp.]
MNTDVPQAQLLRDGFDRHLLFSLGKNPGDASAYEAYVALSLSIRDIMRKQYVEGKLPGRSSKRVYYLSMEFLIGQMLGSHLINLNLASEADRLLKEAGFSLEKILALEPDAALGNGGLGRLAACFLDSAASLDIPVFGAGLCYEFGLFKQSIANGEQRESPDVWLERGYPWLIDRQDISYRVEFYGRTQHGKTVAWLDTEVIMARARDMVQPGFRNDVVTHLRLWWAEHSSEFRLDYFQHGDYLRAMEDQVRAESISKLLYPSDNHAMGYELRLKQEYFLVSATLQDALRTFLATEKDFEKLPDHVFFQLNDTHPAVAVAELMRLLVDVNHLEWNNAWDITRRCIGYTNHTIMPEALEVWNLELFGRLLPRHLEIIYDINFRFLKWLREQGTSEQVIERVSVIQEGHPKKIRMANLAVVGSSAVNGVSALHSRLVRENLFPDYAGLWPEKFHSKTNGVTFRRWLISANPALADLITATIGDSWLGDQRALAKLGTFKDDAALRARWLAIKDQNRQRLRRIIADKTGQHLPTHTFFDVHVKRIHEYKRQLLNCLRIIRIIIDILAGTDGIDQHRTFVFAGKAAPSYHKAKLIIRLIHALADHIEKNPAIKKKIQVVFLPNFCVSLAEKIYPASDLSEQISTAGTEASGTGNMKFMLNGVPTLGTLDGANIEIGEEVGAENIYIFGHTIEGIRGLAQNGYNPVALAETPLLAEVLQFMTALGGDFRELKDALTYQGDPYFHLADFESYMEIQRKILADFQDEKLWFAKCLANTAHAGKFSSDRMVAEYARDIWRLDG